MTDAYGTIMIWELDTDYYWCVECFEATMLKSEGDFWNINEEDYNKMFNNKYLECNECDHELGAEFEALN